MCIYFSSLIDRIVQKHYIELGVTQSAYSLVIFVLKVAHFIPHEEDINASLHFVCTHCLKLIE